MAVIDIEPLSSSSWIAATSVNHADTNVSRVGDIYIDFSRTVSTKSLTGCAKLQNSAGTEIADVFDIVDIGNDYNSISRRLTLHIHTPLEALTEYTLVIDGLYSPTGDAQDQDHVLTFTTSDGTADLDPGVPPIDYVKVVDKTIIDRPLRVIDGESTTAIALVRTLPTNNAYSLAPAYNSGVIALVFSENVGANPENYITVEKRVISTIETYYDTVTAAVATSVSNPKEIDISLPEATEGVYIEPGYEYRVTIAPDLPVGESTLGTERSIRFCGRLSPMFASVQNVLMNYPGSSSYDVALSIFYASLEALSVKPNMELTAPTKPAVEYVLYSTLARIADIGGEDFKSIQLMDLVIDRGNSPSLSAKWRALADMAWDRLSGGAPRVGVKGGTQTSPFVTRDWSA